jgi:hypothetical protein
MLAPSGRRVNRRKLRRLGCMSLGRLLPVYIWLKRHPDGFLLFRRTAQTHLVPCSSASQPPYQVADADFYISDGCDSLPSAPWRNKGRRKKRPAEGRPAICARPTQHLHIIALPRTLMKSRRCADSPPENACTLSENESA